MKTPNYDKLHFNRFPRALKNTFGFRSLCFVFFTYFLVFLFLWISGRSKVILYSAPNLGVVIVFIIFFISGKKDLLLSDLKEGTYAYLFGVVLVKGPKLNFGVAIMGSYSWKGKVYPVIVPYETFVYDFFCKGKNPEGCRIRFVSPGELTQDDVRAGICAVGTHIPDMEYPLVETVNDAVREFRFGKIKEVFKLP